MSGDRPYVVHMLHHFISLKLFQTLLANDCIKAAIKDFNNAVEFRALALRACCCGIGMEKDAVWKDGRRGIEGGQEDGRCWARLGERPPIRSAGCSVSLYPREKVASFHCAAAPLRPHPRLTRLTPGSNQWCHCRNCIRSQLRRGCCREGNNIETSLVLHVLALQCELNLKTPVPFPRANTRPLS